MAIEELIESSRQSKAFRLAEKSDERSLRIFLLLYSSFVAIKSVPWKRLIKFLVCAFVVTFVLFVIYGLCWLALQSDANTENMINSAPPCPCRMSTRWSENRLDFNADPACDARKSGYWNCRFHQGAKGCYRQKSAASAAGAQCCYDNNGEWISDWRKGAGTLDFYYPENGRSLSTYQHFFSDVLSYFSCCNPATAILHTCEQYMRYRPTGKCECISATCR